MTTDCIPPIYNEGTDVILEAAFADELGVPSLPNVNPEFRLDDADTGEQVLDWTEFTGVATTMQIRIEAQYNVVTAAAGVRQYHARRVTVRFDYGGGSPTKAGTGEYVYLLRRVAGLHASP